MVARRRESAKFTDFQHASRSLMAREKVYSALVRTRTDGPQKAAAAALSSGALIPISCNEQTWLTIFSSVPFTNKSCSPPLRKICRWPDKGRYTAWLGLLTVSTTHTPQRLLRGGFLLDTSSAVSFCRHCHLEKTQHVPRSIGKQRPWFLLVLGSSTSCFVSCNPSQKKHAMKKVPVKLCTSQTHVSPLNKHIKRLLLGGYLGTADVSKHAG